MELFAPVLMKAFNRLARSGLGWCVVASLLGSALAGCGGDDEPVPACSPVDGVWSVSLDYGNGRVGKQEWTIAEAGCDVTLAADPPDLYGPALSGAKGSVGEGWMRANWSTTVDACRYYSNFEAFVSRDAFAGTIDWSRGPYGHGYCSGGIGSIAVTGRR